MSNITVNKRNLKSPSPVLVIGGGLSGCECVYQLAMRGIECKLVEQKPLFYSPAHSNKNLAEIVCSNSLKSEDPSSASGMLKGELMIWDSMLLKMAEKTKVPSGAALAVDREEFSKKVTEQIERLEFAEVVNTQVEDIDLNANTVICTGPLTSGKLYENLKAKCGGECHYYDASAPIVDGDTIDMSKAFVADRYGKGQGDGDYINCPLNKEQYETFVKELVAAEKVQLKSFEDVTVFEGCMPIEIMASRGEDSLRFGPMRPVGFTLPDGSKPYAIVQLRKESNTNNMYNLVGFQTNLLYGEQKRVFSLIPGLENASFVKYGVMHRNSYLNAPKVLNKTLNFKDYPNSYVAGVLCGVEGYVESIATGLAVALNIAAKLDNKKDIPWDSRTMIGSLVSYIVSANQDNFQPMNANFGIVDNIDENLAKELLKKYEGKNTLEEIVLEVQKNQRNNNLSVSLEESGKVNYVTKKSKISKKDKKFAITLRGLELTSLLASKYKFRKV